MFMTPWKSFAPRGLLLEHESYLLYINLDYKGLGYKVYTTILKNLMQKTLNAITSENRTILHTVSTIRDVIDVSCKLGTNLALISLNVHKHFTE